ncbi:MAG: pyridoxal 5'-phosphate synthase glutaminase subunit PdxT, partial [Nocardioides sp.]|uniref:pyridoxal 5'-phosphate synthase glutaminase subunit PdxT n=1 Tax=Nocardioides sp. TaxID=35761 RepID=UPI003F117C35
AVRGGLPAFGTCAGMILLADRIEDGAAGQETIGGLDVTVRRNAFGRQVDSFETDLAFTGLEEPVHAVFIRAPAVESVGAGVEVLARVRGEGEAGAADHGRIVAVRQGHLMATSFHPEVGGDTRVHRSFVDLVRST